MAAALFLLAVPARSQDEGLHKVFGDYYEYLLRENPEMATNVGRRDYNDRWGDPSPEHMLRRRASLQEFLSTLHAFPEPGSGQDRLSYRILETDLKDGIEAIDTLATYNVVNHFFGGHLGVFRTFDHAPAKTVKDYEDQIARLRALPQWVDRNVEAGNYAIEHKKLQPKLVAKLEIKQLEVEMEPEALKSPLLKAFTAFPDSIPAADRQRLQAAAVDAYNTAFKPAWQKLHNFVSNVYLPAARDAIGLSDAFNGKEMYAFRVRNQTTTDYTPEHIHEIGLQEVDRVSKEMAKIREELGFHGSTQEFSDQVLNAPQFRFHSEEEIVDHGRVIAKRIDPELPKLFKVLPRMTYGVAPIPKDQARTAAPFYQAPALDGSRSGYFYLRTVDPEKQSSCCMESLILHESVPGHHLQIALAQELQGVPEFRKVSGFTAFIEGWGLYAETLGAALHMYQNPYERYGRLQTEIFRAARLVVDTGIHSQGWTRQKAVDYLYASGANPSRDFMQSEVDRYIAIPGQALAYKIGQLKIAELRSLAEKELGPKFDVRDFHDVVLRNGALPLAILEEQVKEWIAQTKA